MGTILDQLTFTSDDLKPVLGIDPTDTSNDDFLDDLVFNSKAQAEIYINRTTALTDAQLGIAKTWCYKQISSNWENRTLNLNKTSNPLLGTDEYLFTWNYKGIEFLRKNPGI